MRRAFWSTAPRQCRLAAEIRAAQHQSLLISSQTDNCSTCKCEQYNRNDPFLHVAVDLARRNARAGARTCTCVLTRQSQCEIMCSTQLEVVPIDSRCADCHALRDAITCAWATLTSVWGIVVSSAGMMDEFEAGWWSRCGRPAVRRRRRRAASWHALGYSVLGSNPNVNRNREPPFGNRGRAV